MPDVNIGEFLRMGGVYYDIEGSNPAEAFKSICSKIKLPPSITANQLCEALTAREAVLSTAVGKGVSIPHAQQPILKNFGDQRIYICYLKEPIEMHAMDNKKVSVMIVLLTSSVQSHLHMISRLARLLQNSDFKKALDLKLGLNEIYPLTRQL